MATSISESVPITVDGKEILVTHLSIKKLRKFSKKMKEFSKISGGDDGEVPDDIDDESLDILVQACQICLEGIEGAEELVKSKIKFEEVMDIPTIWKILEVAGGVQSDPNQKGFPGMT